MIFHMSISSIPLHKAKEIIFSLSPKLVTDNEFLAFAEIARHECEDYYILGGDELYTGVRHTKLLDREIKDSVTDYIEENSITQVLALYNIPNFAQDTAIAKTVR